jgi:hypothetical protein
MTIETKYNVGDKVYFKLLKKPIPESVRIIDIQIGMKGEVYIGYLLNDGRVCDESELFPSKQDLLNSL